MTIVNADVSGNVWKILVVPGDEVEEGDVVAILESMKMEIPHEAETSGTVGEVKVEEGQSVKEGDVLVILQ